MKGNVEPIILDSNSDLDDIFDMSKICLKINGVNITDQSIEKYADELISSIQKNEDIYILLKNNQEKSVGYVALDHINKEDSHRIYSLFILPEYRQLGYATDLLSQLPSLVDDSVYIDIFSQEDYSKQHIDISVERLKNLFIKSDYEIARNGHSNVAYKLKKKISDPTKM